MKEALITVAAIVVIIGGLLIIHERVSAKCFDFWPFNGKACIATVR